MCDSKLTKNNMLLAMTVLAFAAEVFCTTGLKAQSHPDVFTQTVLDKNGIAFDLSGNLKVEYILSRYDILEGQYVDVELETTIDPHKSALVIVDVWNRKYLDSMVINFINPLIKKLSRLGVKIIYAPSQNEQNDSLFIAEGSITFFHSETMDDYLFYHEIENLFYVGFDTYYCLNDKPNGIFSYRLRNHDGYMKTFVFEQGVMSETKEMKEVALALLKKQDVGVIESDTDTDDLVFPDSTLVDLYANTTCEIDTGNNFVLIFESDIVTENLDQFKDYLAEKDVRFGVVRNDVLTYNDLSLTGISEFLRLLKQLEIRNLYYCGYHLNDEILWSEFGVTPLYIKKRYSRIWEIPRVSVINDLSYVIPSVSIDPEIEKAVVINHYRDIGNILSATLTIGLRRRDTVVAPFHDTTYDWRFWRLPVVFDR